MRYRILNTLGEAFAPEAKALSAALGTVDYRVPSQDELIKSIGNYEVAVIGLANNFSKEVLESATRLKLIATATTGLDHIDLKEAERRGVKVLSLKGEEDFLDTITGTAELAWGLVLALARFIPWSFESVIARHEWKRDDWRGHSLHGKAVGVLGLGRLGRMVARYGSAFGMNVVFTDPSASITARDSIPAGSADFSEVEDYKKVSFAELLRQSDIISIHVHLNSETENLFNTSTLKQMRRDAILINTSRGKIVNEADVLDALENGTIAAYGTDVLADELDFEGGIPDSHPLVRYARDHQNLIILPHIGGMTVESRTATDLFMARKVRDFLSRSAKESES